MKKIEELYEKAKINKLQTEELIDNIKNIELELNELIAAKRGDGEIIPLEVLEIGHMYGTLKALKPDDTKESKIGPNDYYSLWSMDRYQEKTKSTAIYPKEKALEYLALGLVGEAGEVANKVKKVLRGDRDGADPEFKKDLKHELGDVLWYLAQLCEALDINLSDVANTNINKLLIRKNQGKIKGDGDNR